MDCQNLELILSISGLKVKTTFRQYVRLIKSVRWEQKHFSCSISAESTWLNVIIKYILGLFFFRLLGGRIVFTLHNIGSHNLDKPKELLFVYSFLV